jgi:hypothetical protein
MAIALLRDLVYKGYVTRVYGGPCIDVPRSVRRRLATPLHLGFGVVDPLDAIDLEDGQE